MGLSEAKSSSKEWDTLRVKVGFQNCFSVNCIGRSEGLALLWKPDVDVIICSYSNFHIDVVIRNSTPFRITLFYGNPRVYKRKES